MSEPVANSISSVYSLSGDAKCIEKISLHEPSTTRAQSLKRKREQGREKNPAVLSGILKNSPIPPFFPKSCIRSPSKLRKKSPLPFCSHIDHTTLWRRFTNTATEPLKELLPFTRASSHHVILSIIVDPAFEGKDTPFSILCEDGVQLQQKTEFSKGISGLALRQRPGNGDCPGCDICPLQLSDDCFHHCLFGRLSCPALHHLILDLHLRPQDSGHKDRMDSLSFSFSDWIPLYRFPDPSLLFESWNFGFDSALVVALAIFPVLFARKVASKILGLYPIIKRFRKIVSGRGGTILFLCPPGLPSGRYRHFMDSPMASSQRSNTRVSCSRSHGEHRHPHHDSECNLPA